ncbi:MULTISPECIES: hypothetical protein [Amycolatopsis]|uniref:Uncharacterized protein n=2 Tax=Amycolatopsis TaxID=1813 RepID=A0A1I4AUY2_9PSEU|nr:hypothetical protein [Amycolatopsis sacchari]SFK59509.1 hypothetical protein SAMN05421835_12533 [Amycolatopsis sacchari]
MDTNAYVAYLVVAILMVVVDGQIIYHSGKRYLLNSRGNPEAESSMTRLITVLFHLVVLGAIALLSTIHFPGGSSLPSVVGRLGVTLLVIAVAHAIAISVLARMREEQAVEDYNNRVVESRATIDRQLNEPTVQPVPGQEGRVAHVSPNLEQGGPYTSGDGRL